MSAQEKCFGTAVNEPDWSKVVGVRRFENHGINGVLITYVDGDPCVSILCADESLKEELLAHARALCRKLGK
jgi:hypothetical protein